MTDLLLSQEATKETILRTASTKLLGTFWTTVFQDQQFLQGFVDATVSQVVDLYRRTSAVLCEQALDTTQPLDITGWQPITLYKSSLNKGIMTLGPDQTFLGQQPPTFSTGDLNPFSGATAYIGEALDPTKAFCYSLNAVMDVPAVFDVPTGVQASVSKAQGSLQQTGKLLFFEQDPFVLFDHCSHHVINQSGQVVDHVLVLWVKNASVDNRRLQRTYGRLLNWNGASTTAYKAELQALLQTKVKGPTPQAISSLALASGAQVTFKDCLSDSSWWKDLSYLIVPSSSLSFRPTAAIAFKNAEQPVSYIDGVLTIPVLANDTDARAWSSFINDDQRKTVLVSALGLTSGQTRNVNVVDFLMTTLLGSSSAWLKINTANLTQAAKAAGLLQQVHDHLPSHVWIICDLLTEQPSEEVSLSEYHGEAAYLPQTIQASGGRLFQNANPSNWSSDNSWIVWRRPPNVTPSGDTTVVQSPAKAGGLYTTIPAGASTRDVRTLLLIDFN